MKRGFAIFLGLTILLMAQVMLLPRWMPQGFVPDLLMLTVILVGFWKPKGQSFWLGLFFGLSQGWMHGAGWWAFALSRAFAGIFAGWMRTQWLWASPIAAGFCAAITTIATETLLALLLALSERSLTPFALLFTIGSFEAIFNAVAGFAISWLLRPEGGAGVEVKGKVLLALIFLTVSVACPQEKWLLRFSVREGTALNWHIRMVTKKVVNKRSDTEITELWVREQIEQIRPNGNLVWSSQTLRCVINGEVVPVDKTEKTISELTPLGYPTRPFTLPPPSLHQLDDWLLDLFGGVSLVFPATEVKVGDKWHYRLSVGLKPPNEPRHLTINYQLDGLEKVDDRECVKISVKLDSPVRLAWGWKDASIIVTGGAKLEGTFWFDPSLGSVCQRRMKLSIDYTVESERWDGFQFVQTTKYVNQVMEVEAQLSSH